MKDQQTNPFKKYNPNHEVPSEIKEKIMKDISLLQLLGDITDLFSGKMGKTAIELFSRDKNINNLNA
jgi:hypothetical protein